MSVISIICSLLIFLLSFLVTAFLVQAEENSTQALAKVQNEALTKQVLNELVLVEGGTFTMGSDHPLAYKREQPAHLVKVDDFYIGKTEVTQTLFYQVMGWDVSYFQCDTCPVNNVSWMNIQAFISKLNKLTGKTFRLPTEAEWAFAAKGGNRSKGYLYSGSNDINEVAWYAGNAEGKSHPVAQKAPNELGLYDMTGNLWEFCHDDMSQTLFEKGYEPRDNPVFDLRFPVNQKSIKVTRGGGYDFSEEESLVFRRDGATSNVRMPDIGFRLAMDNNNKNTSQGGK